KREGRAGLLLRGGFQAVTDAAHRRDADAAGRELLAQAVHIDFDRVGADLLAPLAQMFDELILAHQPPRTLQEQLQETQLARRELEPLIAKFGDTSDLIESEPSMLDDGGRP